MPTVRFTVSSGMTKVEAMEAVSALFGRRFVEHRCFESTIESTRMPWPRSNWDNALYSRDNGLGINPFIFFDGITVSFKDSDGRDGCELAVEAPVGIIWLFVVPTLIAAASLAVFLPVLWAKILGASAAAGFGAMMFALQVLHYPRKEIDRAVSGGARRRRSKSD